MALVSRKFFLRRSKMQEFLDKLEETPDPDATSMYITQGLSVSEIEDLLGKAGTQSIPDELTQVAADAKNGVVLFWGNARKYLVLPPFPLEKKAILGGYSTEPLRQLISSDFKIGLVLVHLGTYAIGICHGEKLITSKVGTGLVHGRHKKGGSSQQRFQRRRQNQAREFLDRVCLHVHEQFEPQAGRISYIAYGGPRQTVLQLQKRCPFLKAFEGRTLPLLDIPALRQRVLETAVGSVWSSCIIEWQED